MSNLRILISGASVAGPALAYWLAVVGCQVTIVERAPELRVAGQGIDIRGAARDVVKQMGLWDSVLEKSSHEEGIHFVNGKNKPIASFAADTSGKGKSFSCDVEILRGELARVLYSVTKDKTSYIFGDMVQSLEQSDKDVRVHFANGTPSATFDLVVAADGLGSKIRGMAFDPEAVRINSLNAYTTYFSVPPGETDSMWSRAYSATGGRSILVRPDNVGRTRVFLTMCAYTKSDERLARFAEASQSGVEAQKALLQELFHDAGWELPRLLKGMHESDDLYLQHIAQVRMDRWSAKRVVCLGDAGFAPSPFTGKGTSLAILGAYLLAGEITRQPDNIPAALDSYERVFRPHVESTQKIPPGIPWIINPQSKTGVNVLKGAVWFAYASKLTKILSKVGDSLSVGDDKFKLPHYEAFK